MGILRIDIVIPTYNEERYIEQCLLSVLAFTKPEAVQWQIYVVDGMSTDGTRGIVEGFAAAHPDVHLIENPRKIQSSALNIAIRNGSGDYVLRLDAHAKYTQDYLLRCLDAARTSCADNVGGVCKTMPGGDTYQAKAVQAVTTHRFGVGNSEFRLQPKAGPVDTVPFGFFKRDVFERVGLFDERLVRNQDYEMNRRIAVSGGRIWIDPRIVAVYYNQGTIAGFLRKQFFKEGPYNAYLWYLAPYARAYRHGITGAFAAGVIGGAILSCFSNIIAWVYCSVLFLYAVLALTSSAQQAVRYRDIGHLFVLPWVFFLFHFVHGCGFLSGLGRVLTRTMPFKADSKPWDGAGSFRAWRNN